MTIRVKSIITVSLASFLGTAFLWIFNIYYVLKDWSLFWDGFIIFFIIVLVLVISATIIILNRFKIIKIAEINLNNKKRLTIEEDINLKKALATMPLMISLINVVGFFLGPVIKHVLTALSAGINPLNLTLITSIIYSVSIGIYIAFIEIRLMEGFFQTVQLSKGEESINLKNREHSWSKRQYILGLTISAITFGLMFPAGKGFLSGIVQGLSQEIMTKYFLQMSSLGVLIFALSWLAIKIDTAPTVNRIKEMNGRLEKMAAEEVNTIGKMVIIRDDELGVTAHWINLFIDRQSQLMNTIGESIDSLASISNELGNIDSIAQSLGTGIEKGISLVQENLQVQEKAFTKVEEDIFILGQNIIQTTKNIEDQNNAMGNNTASVEEMAANIGSVSKNAQGAYDRTQLLQQKAHQSSMEMNELMVGINDIASSAEEVSQSVGQISKVAAQTNLLAMNAAIEAAHAGNVGAGFAVVAAEVRKLAEDSSNTAKNISNMIKKMNDLSTRGLSQAKKAQDSFSDINQKVNLNSELMAEITQAMKEQEGGSREIQVSMEKLDLLSKNVSDITKAQGAQSNYVQDSMNKLSSAANAIRSQMDQNQNQMKDIENFLSGLGDIIQRNSKLVKELKKVSDLS